MYKFKDYLQETKITLKKKEFVINDFVRGVVKQNSDGSYDIDGIVSIRNVGIIKEIPFKFNKVTNYFDCTDIGLISLKNSPKIIEKNFYCGINQLTSLEHGPEFVGGDYECSANHLTSLKGIAKVIRGDFKCAYNNGSKFTEDDVRKLSNVKGKVIIL